MIKPHLFFDKSLTKKPLLMTSLHSHPEYEVYYLLSGKRTFFFSNEMHEITGPTIIIVPPYALHRTTGENCERINIYASPKYLNSFQKSVLDKRSTQIIRPDENQHREFQKLFNEFSVIKSADFKDDIKEALFGYFTILLSKTSVLPAESALLPETKTSLLVVDVIKYFNEHYNEHLTLEGLAKHFFVSKATLNYSFKNYTSCSPMEYLLNIRINKSKTLLTESALTINEIANNCGFSSPNYFGLIFKNKEGISPVNFRKIYR